MKKQFPDKPRHVRPQFAGLTVIIVCVMALFFAVGGVFADNGPAIPPQKQQRLQQLNQQISQASSYTKAKNVSNLSRAAAQPLVTPQAGITQTHEGPFPTSFFTVQNLWQGPVANNWVLAYAGAKPNADDTARQGGLLLYTTTTSAAGSTLHLIGFFPAPGGATMLTIAGINGMLLQVHTVSGSNLTFDLQNHQYQA